jgi:hypothetical protein
MNDKDTTSAITSAITIADMNEKYICDECKGTEMETLWKASDATRDATGYATRDAAWSAIRAVTWDATWAETSAATQEFANE